MLKPNFFSVFTVLLFAGCASVMAPDGGEKDVLPPQVLKTTPDSGALNTKPKQIKIWFDEYYALGNPQQEWVISPAPEKFPDIKTKGNLLEINWLDDFKPNTTYTINTLSSIKDINEGNVLNNYRFIFSTGQSIDSLTLNGYVLLASQLAPISKCAVFLYLQSDTIKNKPAYVSYTNEEGFFTFQNLPPGKFIIQAVEDKNKNRNTEQGEIASLLQKIEIPKTKDIHLYCFPVNTRKQGIKQIVQASPGIVHFITEQPCHFFPVNIQMLAFKQYKKAEQNITTSASTDTITAVFSYTNDIDSALFSVELSDTSFITGVKLLKPDSILRIVYKPESYTENSTLIIPFNLPLSRTSELYLIKKDSAVIPVSPIIEQTQKLAIPFPEGNYFTGLIFPKQSVKSIFNQSIFNADTLLLNYKEDKSRGSISFIITDSMNYPVNVLLLNEKTKAYEYYCNQCKKISFDHIQPATYKVLIQYDLNKDGYLSPGNFLSNNKPEPSVLLKDEIKVKANWQQKDIQLVIPIPTQ